MPYLAALLPLAARTLTEGWRDSARCRQSRVEMVPGGEGEHPGAAVEVLRAKRVCRGCPVKKDCLAAAGRSHGVWGGLTRDERERLRVSSHNTTTRSRSVREVIPCAKCGLDCIPAERDAVKCDGCTSDRERPRSVEALKANITDMIAANCTYGQIAERFGLRVEAVSKACRRWGTPSKAAGLNQVAPMDLAPCGTPAAKLRHRRNRIPITDCACARPGSSARSKRNTRKPSTP